MYCSYLLLGISETCNDGEKNQGETGRDCGGPCPDCGNKSIILQ